METNIYKTNEFLSFIEKSFQENETILNSENIHEYKIKKIKELVQLLNIDVIREKLTENELHWEIRETVLIEDIIIEKYDVYAIKHLIFPVYIIKKQKNNGISLLYLHGHDPCGVQGTFNLNNDKIRYHKNITLKLASCGYIVVAPDLLGHGDSIYEYLVKGRPTVGQCSYHTNFFHIFGLDLTAIRVCQTMCCLDFCNKKGISISTIFGMSGGGLVAGIVSAIDNRIKNTIIHSYTNLYSKSIFAKEQCIDNYVHGIQSVGDNYEIISLSVPKKMLLINGEWDRSFPIEGTKFAFCFIQNVYKQFGIASNLRTIIFKGAHEICIDEVTKWLEDTVG